MSEALRAEDQLQRPVPRNLGQPDRDPARHPGLQDEIESADLAQHAEHVPEIRVPKIETDPRFPGARHPEGGLAIGAALLTLRGRRKARNLKAGFEERRVADNPGSRLHGDALRLVRGYPHLKDLGRSNAPGSNHRRKIHPRHQHLESVLQPHCGRRMQLPVGEEPETGFARPRMNL